MATKQQVFVVTTRDEDGTWWLMHGELDCITTGWAGPYEARTFQTKALAMYVVQRIRAKRRADDYLVGPAHLGERMMLYGFKEWINGKGK